jgi:hypothetical protein
MASCRCPSSLPTPAASRDFLLVSAGSRFEPPDLDLEQDDAHARDPNRLTGLDFSPKSEGREFESLSRSVQGGSRKWRIL